MKVEVKRKTHFPMNEFCEKFKTLENKRHRVLSLLKNPDSKDKFIAELKQNFDNLYDMGIGVDFNSDFTEFKKYRFLY